MCIDVAAIMEHAGKPDDSGEDHTRRMALVSESLAIFNGGRFTEIRRDLIALYGAHADLRMNTLPTVLLTEFNTWCKSFITRIQVQKKEGAKYDKRRHQRAFMQWSTLLACFAHALQDTRDAFLTMPDIFGLPPVLRLHHVVRVGYDEDRAQRTKHIKGILTLYSDGLVSLSQHSATDSPRLHDVASQCTDMMLDKFKDLRNLLVREADPRLAKSFQDIFPQ
jgi:hypothetical protein